MAPRCLGCSWRRPFVQLGYLAPGCYNPANCPAVWDCMYASKEPVQQCPICQAQQPLEATRCALCGAALNGIPVATVSLSGKPALRRRSKTALEGPIRADWDEGDSDLYEGVLPSIPLRGILVIVVTVAVIAGIAFFVVTQVAGTSNDGSTAAMLPTLTATSSRPTDVPTAGAAAPLFTVPPTNTKIPASVIEAPTLALPTVTPAPATPTITPTRGPCMQKVKKGDTVYGLAARCGHRDLAIVDVILELNNMKDATQLQVGQVLEIPWPTPTGGPPAQSGNASGTPGAANAGATSVGPTLPPGVMWYTVKKGDTAVSIAYKYHTTMKILRDLNPEIQFLQCDFGLPGGGPACTLKPMLGEGQSLRVPAPTPTPTLSPTLTGSETATPTATATFNAPFSQSPSDNMLFESSEVPTLRWVASGELNPNEVYLITVRDMTASVTYIGTTRELSFQLPTDWQPTDGKRHVFEWSVAVALKNDSGTPTPTAFTTETRTFTWMSR
jgi:LysM repeat protein